MRADNGELAHLGLWLCHHTLHHCHNTLRQSLTQTFRIEGVIVLHDNTTRFYLDIDLELRHVQFQEFLTDSFSTNGIFRQHTHLISVSDRREETIIGGDTGKRIILVLQGLIEGLTGLLQELTDCDIIDVQSQCQGVDKHTHCIGNLQIRATAADRTKINLAVVGVARHYVSSSSQEQMGWRDKR